MENFKKFILLGIAGGSVVATGSAHAFWSSSNSNTSSCSAASQPSYSYSQGASCGGGAPVSGGFSGGYTTNAGCGAQGGQQPSSGYYYGGNNPSMDNSQTSYSASPDAGFNQGQTSQGGYYYNQGQGQTNFNPNQQGFTPSQVPANQNIQNQQNQLNQQNQQQQLQNQNQGMKPNQQSYRNAGNQNYVADAEKTTTTTTETMKSTVSRDDFVNSLSDQGRALFNRLTPEGQALAIQLANKYPDKIQAIKEAARRISERRQNMNQ